MYIILSIFIIILVSYFFTRILKKIWISATVSLMIVWFFVSLPIIKNNFLLGDSLKSINFLSNIGLISLMFLAGLWSSIKKLKKEWRTSFWASLFGLTFTWFILFSIFYLLWYSIAISILIAICLSISAEWTTAEILLEEKKINSKLWVVMLESWIIDDIIWILLFLIVSFLLKQGYLQDYFITILSLWAFFGWAILKKYLWRYHKLILNLEKWLQIFVIPFFFFSMWFLFDINSILVNPIILIVMLVLAVLWKIFGTYFSKIFVKDLSKKQLFLLWRAMNSRGAIWLAVAIIVFEMWIIPVHIYSSIVITTFVTTITFPFIMKYFLNKHKNIMN